MTKPIEIAVVGHTNAGKTSLIRTLTRRRDFGVVSEHPGSTRRNESLDIKVGSKSLVRYVDTPGLEDAMYLERHFIELYNDDRAPHEKIDAFLSGPEATRVFEQSAHVLRQMRKADAALYVIDCRDDVLPKFKAEIKLLRDCAKPILPVLNYCRSNDQKEKLWLETLNAYGLHAYVPFDVVAPFVGSELELYTALKILLPNFRESFQLFTEDIARRHIALRATSCRVIAEALISIAALRQRINKEDLSDDVQKEIFIKEFQAMALAKVRQAELDLFDLYGFDQEELSFETALKMTGRWDVDIFDPKVLKDAAARLSIGAAVGAAIGLAVDAMSAFVTLGGGLAVGIGIGSIASQGFSRLSIRLKNKWKGIHEVMIEDTVLLLFAENLTAFARVLAARSHASEEKISLAEGEGDGEGEGVGEGVPLTQTAETKQMIKNREAALSEVIKSLRAARAEPQWADATGRFDRARQKLSDKLEQNLLRTLVTSV